MMKIKNNLSPYKNTYFIEIHKIKTFLQFIEPNESAIKRSLYSTDVATIVPLSASPQALAFC